MKLTKEINFLKKCPKLNNQEFARLLAVFAGMTGAMLRDKFPDLYFYDTDLGDGTFFGLDRDETYLMLLFKGDNGLLFTTFRKENSENIVKYNDSIGQIFRIVIDK